MYVHFAPHHSSDLSRWLPSAGPKEYLLGNKPFHHTVDWREVAIAFNPEGAQREELKYPETSPTTSKRKEERAGSSDCTTIPSSSTACVAMGRRHSRIR